VVTHPVDGLGPKKCPQIGRARARCHEVLHLSKSSKSAPADGGAAKYSAAARSAEPWGQEKTARIVDPAAKGTTPTCVSFGLYVRGSAPYAVEPKLSRIRSRLDSTGPGNPLGSLDLSGQRHICRADASPNEDPIRYCTAERCFVNP
jgi:hypothetical protein